MRVGPSTWLLALAAVFPGCGGEPPRARVGIAIEANWYPAVRLAQEDLGPLPADFIFDSTRLVHVAPAAISYAEWLADSGVAVVIGHSNSRGSVAAANIYQRRGIVQLAPIATSRALTRDDIAAFALVPDDSAEGAFMAAFVDEGLGARRVALLYHHDDYGLGIRDGVAAELERRGIAVVDERFLAPSGVESGEALVERLLAAALLKRPDAIVLGAREAETRLVAQSLRRRGRRLPVVASDASYVLPPERAARTLAAVDGVHIVRFWGADRDAAGAAFARRFEERYGFPPDQAEALTYDAVMLVGAAIRGGARSAEDFRRYFSALGTELEPAAGLAGPYGFVRGRPREARMEITVVRGGRIVPHALGERR